MKVRERREIRETPIHRAARVGDHDAIRRLVADGCDVDELLDIQRDVGNPPDCVTPLAQAVASNDGASVDTVRLLLELGASIDPDGARSIPWSASIGLARRNAPAGSVDRFRYVLDRYAERVGRLPDGMVEGWLRRVARGGNPEMVRALLDLGADPNGVGDRTVFSPPIYAAVDSGSVPAVRVLLDAGADPNLRCRQVQCLLKDVRSLEMLDLLLDTGTEISPPVQGSDRPPRAEPERVLAGVAGAWKVDRAERVRMIRRLVEARDLSQVDLDRALYRTNSEGIVTLCEAGADLSSAPFLLGVACFDSMWVDLPGIGREIEAVIALGFDPNEKDENGFCPILTAVGPDTFGPGFEESDGYSRPAALALIRAGVDLDVVYPPTDIEPLEDVDVVGFTPLLIIAMYGDGVVVKAMLDAGADPAARTPDGRTALDLAVAALDRATVRLHELEPLPPAADFHAARRHSEERERLQMYVDDAQLAVRVLRPT